MSRQYCRSFQHVAQFPDVFRPMIFRQSRYVRASSVGVSGNRISRAMSSKISFTRLGRSSSLFLSGGSSMDKTFSLKNKSPLNRPFSTSFRRSRLVAASSLAMIVMLFLRPHRVNDRVSRNVSNFACSKKESSPTSLEQQVPPSASSRSPVFVAPPL